MHAVCTVLTCWGEVAVAHGEDRVEHGLEEEAVPHPLGHDNVHVLDGELNVLGPLLDDRDLVLEPCGA